jgi:hypothetical protein
MRHFFLLKGEGSLWDFEEGEGEAEEEEIDDREAYCSPHSPDPNPTRSGWMQIRLSEASAWKGWWMAALGSRE